MLKLHMIPTNGDATLLQFKENGECINILIDGGNRKDDCFSYLKSIGVDRLHLVIVSHLDEDHIRGLRRVVNELTVDELWITDVSPFIAPAAQSPFMMKCLIDAKLIVDGKGIANGGKIAVYDGFKRQLGPFFIEVLSPPKSLHNYLRRPDVIEKILKSPKGQSISRYIQDEIERRLRDRQNSDNPQSEHQRNEIVSEVIKQFELDVPQREEIENSAGETPIDWSNKDRQFYESARSLFNDISIVVRIAFDYQGRRKTFLFPGDLTNWSLLMANYPNRIRRCITKVPHHGSEIYVDAEDYHSSLLASYVSSGDPISFHLKMLCEECIAYAIRNRTRPLSWPLPLSKRKFWLSHDLDYDEIYEFLSPKHSIIYPFKRTKSLPLLGVRNAIKENSMRTTCNFNEGRLLHSSNKPDDSCMDCYNCHERNEAVVFSLS